MVHRRLCISSSVFSFRVFGYWVCQLVWVCSRFSLGWRHLILEALFGFPEGCVTFPGAFGAGWVKSDNEDQECGGWYAAMTWQHSAREPLSPFVTTITYE